MPNILIPLYIVDAFTDEQFKGNPAAICPLNSWLDKEIMQNIAMENNLSETAFFVSERDGFGLKWFTPQVEVDLCGHATLAAAYIISHHLGCKDQIINFYTNSGRLSVEIGELITLDFPSIPLKPSAEINGIEIALGAKPIEVLEGNGSLLCLFKTEKEIQEMTPDFSKLKLISARIIYVTAPGNKLDFVSRVFAPAVGVNEDPVTGSAHCSLIPYWASRLSKNHLFANQISKRGGALECRLEGDRVKISGKAILFSKGEININI